jgi:hypothetical protein
MVEFEQVQFDLQFFGINDNLENCFTSYMELIQKEEKKKEDEEEEEQQKEDEEEEGEVW